MRRRSGGCPAELEIRSSFFSRWFSDLSDQPWGGPNFWRFGDFVPDLETLPQMQKDRGGFFCHTREAAEFSVNPCDLPQNKRSRLSDLADLRQSATNYRH
jgi:hypothetical protein